LLTHSPDTYKIPAVGDTPEIFNVAFLSQATQANVIHGSKAVGEPPLMLALSVREAIRDAIAAFGAPGGEVPVASPATCEAISNAIAGRSPRSDRAVAAASSSAAVLCRFVFRSLKAAQQRRTPKCSHRRETAVRSKALRKPRIA
jgi:hypothetical protein